MGLSQSSPHPPAPQTTVHEPKLVDPPPATTLLPSDKCQPDSISTPIGQNGLPVVDAKLEALVEQRAEQIKEQEATIKELNEQLTHCQNDLQIQVDLVATLKMSLLDSEKKLRIARVQAAEIHREREVPEANHEVITLQQSPAIVEEKQHLMEQRLDEERRAKERVRQQLETRMQELQKRKSKFASL